MERQWRPGGGWVDYLWKVNVLNVEFRADLGYEELKLRSLRGD